MLSPYIQLGTKEPTSLIIMVDDTRIVAHFPAEKLVGERHTYIIGVGGGGSLLVNNLLRLNWPSHMITVFDDDTVEEHNVTNQVYGPEEVGLLKVEAINQKLGYMGEVNIEPIRVEEEFLDLDGIVVCQTDDFKTRHTIFENQIAGNGNIELFIDSRVGALSSRIYMLDPSNEKHCEKYLKTLPKELDEDGSSENSLCGTRVSIHAMLSNTASLVAITLQEYLRNIAGMNDPALELPNARMMTPATGGIMTQIW